MAVERRDIDALIEASDRGIRLGFDGSGGVDPLRKLFTDRSELWDELRVVLAGGGRFSAPTSFAAPYVYANWPDRFDSFECAAVTGANVRLRMAPRLDAPIIASVSYSIVHLVEPATGALWSRVQLGDGRTGSMWHAYVRSPIDYRALFNVIDGRWRMTAFCCGRLTSRSRYKLNTATSPTIAATAPTTNHVVIDVARGGGVGSRYPVWPHRGHGEDPSSPTRTEASSSFVSGPNQRHDEHLK